MKELYTKKNTADSQNEVGFYLVFSAFIIVAILTFIGLAIDAGNLYLAQLRMQRVVDAAAIKAANLGQTAIESEVTPDYNQIKSTTSEFAQRTFASMNINNATVNTLINLRSGIINPGDTIPGGNYQPVFTSSIYGKARANVQVQASREVDLLLLSSFPGYNSKQTVTARANSVIGANKLMTVLVIDTSRSMHCDLVGVDKQLETCKIHWAQEKAKEFIQKELLPGDYVAVVAFDAFARRIFPSDPNIHGLTVYKASDASGLNGVIDTIWQGTGGTAANPGPIVTTSSSIHNHTNIFDGLRLAHRLINEMTTINNVSRQILLFSDGNPTLGWDACQWNSKQEAYLPAFGDPSFPPQFDAADASNFDAKFCPITPDNLSRNTALPTDLAEKIDSESDDDNGVTRFVNFRLNARPSSLANCNPNIPQWRIQDAYLAAINLSDKIREDGITIHAIGVGMINGLKYEDPVCDPVSGLCQASMGCSAKYLYPVEGDYQYIDRTESSKLINERFLKRIANATDSYERTGKVSASGTIEWKEKTDHSNSGNRPYKDELCILNPSWDANISVSSSFGGFFESIKWIDPNACAGASGGSGGVKGMCIPENKCGCDPRSVIAGGRTARAQLIESPAVPCVP